MRILKLKNKKHTVPFLMIVIIVSKLIGMLRDIVLANYFGTSYISDAYLIASSVPTLLFYFIGHSISTAYIPMYNKVKYDEGKESAQRFTNNLINVSFLIGTVIVIFLMVWPQVAVKLFAAGFDEKTAELAARFIRISTLSIYVMTLVYVFNGYLQANGNFLTPAAISIPRNVVIMISIVVAAVININLLGWGLILAYVAEFLLLLPFVVRKGYRYKPIIDFKDNHMKQTVYIIMPILLGMCVSQVNKIIDRSIASTVIEGGISALSYASIINTAVQEVLVTGIITVLFASCAELVSKGEFEKVKEKLQNTINNMSFILIPATFGIIVLAEQIVKVVLNRGNFDAVSIKMTTGALMCYTVGLFFLAIRDTIVKVFYAYKDTKTTTITSISAIAVNIVLNFILSRFWGINGLAIATSFSAVFNSITLYFALRKKIGDFGLKKTAYVILKSLIAALIMAVVVYNSASNIHNIISSELIALMVNVLLGMVVYSIVSYILKIEPMIKLISKGIGK